MSKIIVDSDRPLPLDVLRKIKAIDPRTRGVGVNVDTSGTRFVCGRLTLRHVVGVLLKAGHTFSVYIYSGKQDRSFQPMDHSRYMDEQPRTVVRDDLPLRRVIFPAPVDQPKALKPQPPESPLVTQQRALYREGLSTLPESRAIAVDVALTCICDNINSKRTAEEEPMVYPWFLADFPDFPKRSNKVSLTRLNQIEPSISHCVWDFVHAYEGVERDDGSTTLEDLTRTEDNLLVIAEVIPTDISLLQQFHALARTSV